MRILSLLSLFMLLSGTLRAMEPEFPLTEDSKPKADVPKGVMIKGTHTARDGSLFPGTVREYSLYLPAGFDKSRPAPFMVFQDGVIYQAPVVFDNLIARKEIPPLVGVFVKPGVVPAVNENALPRFNRSFEYDSVTSTYATFLIEELIPALEAKHGILLSTDPNDAAISGNSSGGIAAFMVAWHRPDRFRRIFTGVGTYVGIHGADQLPVLVRKTEPKPLKVFLQSGTHDNNLYCGDWWMANQTMERALTWVGYDVNHAWGEGGHDQKHASQIFPEVLRWLWAGWPENKEVKADPRKESNWKGSEVLSANESKWTPVTIDRSISLFSRLVPDQEGNVHTLAYGPPVDSPSSETDPRIRVTIRSDNKITSSPADNVKTLVAARKPLLLAMNDHESETVKENSGAKDLLLLNKITSGGMAITHTGRVFWNAAKVIFTRTQADAPDTPLWGHPGSEYNGLALSPDQTVLYALVGSEVDTFTVGSESPLSFRQSGFVQLEPGPTFDLCVDMEGRLYVATESGIQVCDQAGRVNFIISTPGFPTAICFGGRDLSELFIIDDDKIYKRPMKVHGIVSGQMPPIKPAAPKL